MRCAVYNCKNNNEGRHGIKDKQISFFTFPSDKVLLKVWIAFCRRKDKLNVLNGRICSVHFRPDDYVNTLKYEMGFCSRKLLKKDAYPTIYIPGTEEVRNRVKKEDSNSEYSELIAERNNMLILNEESTYAVSEMQENDNDDEMQIFFDGLKSGLEPENSKSNVLNTLDTSTETSQLKEKEKIQNDACSIEDIPSRPTDSTSMLFQSLALSVKDSKLSIDQLIDFQAGVCEFFYGKLAELQEY